MGNPIVFVFNFLISLPDIKNKYSSSQGWEWEGLLIINYEWIEYCH